jgi:hypothetical protein
MFSRRSHCFLYAGFLLLFGCVNPRTASTSTFKTAIQAALREDPLFLMAPIPVEFADSHGTHYTDDRLEALVNVGVLDKVSVMVRESPFSGMLEDRKRRVLSFRKLFANGRALFANGAGDKHPKLNKHKGPVPLIVIHS